MDTISTTTYKTLPIGMLLNPAEDDDSDYLSSSPPSTSRFSSRAPSLSSIYSNSPPSPLPPRSRLAADELTNDNISSVAKLLSSKNTRSTLPREVLDILNEWLLEHLDDPYPTSQEKRELLVKTGLTKVQLSNWFINVRRRKIFSFYYDLARRSRELQSRRNLTATSERGYCSTSSSSSYSKSSSYISLASSASSEALSSSSVPSDYYCDDVRDTVPIVPITRRKKLIDRLRDLKRTMQSDININININEGRSVERGVYL